MSDVTTSSFRLHDKVDEIKALLFHNQGQLSCFTFAPLRTVTFTGEVVAYKIRPLLADENGCMTIRILPGEMEAFITLVKEDQDLTVRQTTTRLFNIPSIPKYEIALSSTPTGEIRQPTVALHPMPSAPLEQRCEPDWMENEGYAASVTAEMSKALA